MIIVTDNPTTRYDYDHLLHSNGQAGPWPAFGLGDPDDSERRNREGCQPIFHLDFAFSSMEVIKKIKGSLEADLPYSVVVIDLQDEPWENEMELARQVWQVDPNVQVVICTETRVTNRTQAEMARDHHLVAWRGPRATKELVPTKLFPESKGATASQRLPRVGWPSHRSVQVPEKMADFRQQNLRLQNDKMELNLNRLELSNRLKEKQFVLHETEKCSLFALQSVIVARYPPMGKMIPRLQVTAQVLAEQLSVAGPYRPEISEEFLKQFFFSTPLYDVGKVGIPDSILGKNEKLTRNEQLVLQQHTVVGFEILNSALQRFPSGRFAQMSPAIARHHHERWDGEGYPDGLKRNFIPLPARIVAVASAFVASTPEGPNRPPHNMTLARETIQAGSNSRFDPYIVDAFIDCFDTICKANQDLAEKRRVLGSCPVGSP